MDRSITILLSLTLVTAGLLASCSPATDNKPTNITPASEYTVPTAASLVGSWKTSNVNSGVTYSAVTTTTFGSDNTYIKKSVYVSTPASGGTSTTYYSDSKGTFAVDGVTLKFVKTATRASNVAFNSDTTGWFTLPTAVRTSSPALIAGGALHIDLVLTVQGAASSMVGSWEIVTYDSEHTKAYTKRIYNFKSDGTFECGIFDSIDPTFSATADSTWTGTYTTADGVLTLSLTGGTPILYAYKIIAAKYLVLAIGKDSKLGYTKQ